MARGRLAPALRIVSIITVLNWGCYVWRSEPLVPSTGANEARASALRVWLADSSEFVLYDARIRADSVTGFRAAEQSSRTAISSHRTAISRRDISVLEVRHLHAGKTVALALGVAAVTGAVVFLIAVSQIEVL